MWSQRSYNFFSSGPLHKCQSQSANQKSQNQLCPATSNNCQRRKHHSLPWYPASPGGQIRDKLITFAILYSHAVFAIKNQKSLTQPQHHNKGRVLIWTQGLKSVPNIKFWIQQHRLFAVSSQSFSCISPSLFFYALLIYQLEFNHSSGFQTITRTNRKKNH